jgi:UPF0755 protein
MRKLGGLFVLLAILAGAVYVLGPQPGSHEKVSIVIHRGGTSRSIADSLSRHDIISLRPVFLALLKWSGTSRRIHAGRYTFSKREGAIAAVFELATVRPKEIAVTIPEGLTVEQTAARIAPALSFDTTEFIDLCRDSAFTAAVAPSGAASLEGFLFPDTYAFTDGTTPAEAIRRMAGQFRQKWAMIDTGLLSPRSLSEVQIVTLASIVEKEAAVASERPRIAGVFYNRIRIGMSLGADPTVRYVFKKFSGPLLASELNTESPYNTRRHAGLPPGPICSPGLASLQAALSPLQTNELYFVAKWDGSGEHEFSTTNEEHNRKKMVIRYHNVRRLRQKGLQVQ